MENNEHNHITIKHLAEDDRPREKLIQKGRQALSDAELLAILLSSGNKNETAIQLAQRILNDQKQSINQLAKLQLNDLKKYKGVGEAKAVTILAALEMGRRRTDILSEEKPKVQTSTQAYQLFKQVLSDLPHEEFWVIFLSRSCAVIKMECVSKGSVNGTLVDIRLVLKPAIENLSNAIIIAHNHPSGNLEPSHEDIKLTKKIKEAVSFMDIALHDHLIIGDGTYYSFADKGLMS